MEVRSFPLDRWNCLLELPSSRGSLRLHPEDFQVDEELGFDLAGNGSHLWILIKKTLLNTVDVVRMLSRRTGIKEKDIGFSGQKDRNAVTSQWFSLPLQCEDEILQRAKALCESNENLTLLEHGLNPGKLRRGTHRRNRFRIRVRDFNGNHDDIDTRLDRLTVEGVPNYFGPQRFGRNGRNMLTVARWFNGDISKLDRTARSMALSSARSWIFNQLLSERIAAGDWLRPRLGDIMMLDGCQSWFLHDDTDATVADRIRSHDIHPSGPMWGRGALASAHEVEQWERSIVEAIPLLPSGLEKHGLSQQRRAYRTIPDDLQYTFPATDILELRFGLPRGAFATSLLRELVVT